MTTQLTKKPGPQAQGPRIDALEAKIITLEDQIADLTGDQPAEQPIPAQYLEDRLANLERLVIDMASQGGTANLLKNYGFKRLEPTQSQMRKYG